MEIIKQLAYISWVLIKTGVGLVLVGLGGYFLLTLVRIGIEDIMIDRTLLKAMRQQRHNVKKIQKAIKEQRIHNNKSESEKNSL